jgi:hypothetical protein
VIVALGLMLPFWPTVWRLLGLVSIFAYFELALYDALVLARWLNSWLGPAWIDSNIPWALVLGHGLALWWLMRWTPPSVTPAAPDG